MKKTVKKNISLILTLYDRINAALKYINCICR